MFTAKHIVHSSGVILSDYARLVKMRLSILVVFSASMSYLWAMNRNVDTLVIWLLSAGGFFITASANIFNQLYEIESDKLMKRTQNRPLPCKRIDKKNAYVLGLLFFGLGSFLLWRINVLSLLLGVSAFALYVFAYTPLKKKTWLSVVPGALSGSIPVLIGWTAASGSISGSAWMLFLIQFIWQFPHTWSIAWLLNDEYKKAGLKMLPVSGEKTKHTSFIIAISTFLIVPAACLLYMYQSVGLYAWLLLLGLGGILFFSALRFHHIRTEKSALQLMFGCIVFLPILFILLVAEKFL